MENKQPKKGKFSRFWRCLRSGRKVDANQAKEGPVASSSSTASVAPKPSSKKQKNGSVNVATANATSVNLAPVNLAPTNATSVNLAPVNLAPANATSVNLAPVNLAPANAVSVNMAPASYSIGAAGATAMMTMATSNATFGGLQGIMNEPIASTSRLHWNRNEYNGYGGPSGILDDAELNQYSSCFDEGGLMDLDFDIDLSEEDLEATLNGENGPGFDLSELLKLELEQLQAKEAQRKAELQRTTTN